MTSHSWMDRLCISWKARRYINRLGGRAVHKATSPPLRELFDVHETFGRKLASQFGRVPGTRLRVEFAIVQTGNLDAFAVSMSKTSALIAVSDRLILELYAGAICLVQSEQATLLGQPKVRRSADPKVLSESYSLLANVLPVFAASGALDTGHAFRALVDSARSPTIIALVWSSLHFVLYHEVGHILDGHIDLIGERGRLPEIRPEPDVANRQSRFFEDNADSNAVDAFVEAVRTLPEGNEVLGYFNSSDTIRIWLTGTAMLFVLFSMWDPHGIEFLRSTHPFPPYRWKKCIERLHLAGLELPEPFDVPQEFRQILGALAAGDIGKKVLQAWEAFEVGNVSEMYAQQDLAARFETESELRNRRLDRIDFRALPEHVQNELIRRRDAFKALIDALAPLQGQSMDEITRSELFQRVVASPDFRTVFQAVTKRFLRAMNASSLMGDTRFAALIGALSREASDRRIPEDDRDYVLAAIVQGK